MSVHLRCVETGLYYQEASRWTAERPDAFDFEEVTRALELATRPGLESVELVVGSPDGQGDVLLPMKNTTPADWLFFVQHWSSR